MSKKLSVKDKMVGLLCNLIIDSVIGSKKREEILSRVVSDFSHSILDKYVIIAKIIKKQDASGILSEEEISFLDTSNPDDIKMARELFCPVEISNLGKSPYSLNGKPF